ncbi:hypothetical protein [Vibrio navarrensis]|uniref:hypothetical protein n=1 Tax=Vibrio navarrensis TaxID=29495 RepID=UPI003F491624
MAFLVCSDFCGESGLRKVGLCGTHPLTRRYNSGGLVENFPIENLKFTSATISGVDGDVSLEIGIEPFELSLDGYSEEIETVISLYGINVPSELSELTGKTFTFPVNPDEGYIDGSVYFFGAHSPVDITEIKFGESTNGKLPITLKSSWALEFELTGFKNCTTTIQTYLKL